MESSVEMESMQRVFEIFANKPEDHLRENNRRVEVPPVRRKAMTLEEAFSETRKGTRP